MPNHSTLITSDGGLVLGGDGDGVASSPRASVVVVVPVVVVVGVVVAGVIVVVVIVFVVASVLRGSSMVSGVVWAVSLGSGLDVSWRKSSR
jgi:uncharacterized membrane protein